MLPMPCPRCFRAINGLLRKCFAHNSRWKHGRVQTAGSIMAITGTLLAQCHSGNERRR